MNKYNVLQTFTHQGVDYHEGQEVEIEDAKAQEIGSSYLAKIEEGKNAASDQSSEPPAHGSEDAKQE